MNYKKCHKKDLSNYDRYVLTPKFVGMRVLDENDLIKRFISSEEDKFVEKINVDMVTLTGVIYGSVDINAILKEKGDDSFERKIIMEKVMLRSGITLCETYSSERIFITRPNYMGVPVHLNVLENASLTVPKSNARGEKVIIESADIKQTIDIYGKVTILNKNSGREKSFERKIYLENSTDIPLDIPVSLEDIWNDNIPVNGIPDIKVLSFNKIIDNNPSEKAILIGLAVTMPADKNVFIENLIIKNKDSL